MFSTKIPNAVNIERKWSGFVVRKIQVKIVWMIVVNVYVLSKFFFLMQDESH